MSGSSRLAGACAAQTLLERLSLDGGHTPDLFHAALRAELAVNDPERLFEWCRALQRSLAPQPGSAIERLYRAHSFDGI